MPLDESHKYYSLVIPRNESNRVLILSTHEDSSIDMNTKSSFSDPDFYISKKNKYPSSRKSSEWFSEQYGADILSIPSESVGENETFYIGMYCQYRCKYFLRIKTGIESELILKKYNFLRLKSHETMNYKIKINNEFEKLKVMAYSITEGNFKIFMNKESPSSANTFKVIPSWDNGYAIIINKGTNEYCTNCEYHLIIHNEENEMKKEINEIIFYVTTEELNLQHNLNNFIVLYDALEANSKICFNFNITARQKIDEKLILDTVIFSGDATLLIEGWKSKNIDRKYYADKNENSHKIIMEKHIILDKTDFDNFDKEEDYYKNKDSVLHFCLYSQRQISYIIQAYFLSNFEKVKHTSILSHGNTLRAYLLKDQVINYELLIDYYSKSKYNIETNITISERSIAGNISLYAYFCKEDICSLNTKKDIEKINEELISSKKGENPYISILNINHNENYCMKNPKIKLKNGNTIDCATFAIIKCDKPSEERGLCIFDIKLTIQDAEIIMKPKQIYNGMIPLGKTDKYKIIINDENIKTMFVVLNTESGDAQLSVYKEKETSYNKESLISISTHKDYIPDVVKVTPQKINQQNLVGKYIIKVYPETFSNYKIYYYTIYENENKNDKENLPDVTMNLNIGQLISDYFPNDIRYKIYSFTPLLNKKSTIKIFINRVNINFNIFVYTDISKFEIVQMHELTRYTINEPIKGYQWKSNANNEVIISKNDINFLLNKMLYIIVAPVDPYFSKGFTNNYNVDNNNTNLNLNLVSQFFIGIISENTPITVTEGMPHTMTLSTSYSYQIYHRKHSDLNKNLDIVLNVLLGEIDVFASFKYIQEEDINNLDIKSAEYDRQANEYNSNNIIFKLNLKSYSVLKLSSNFIKKQIDNDETTANIYYYIRRSESMISENKTCQYVLVEKTSETKGQILQTGVITKGSLKVGDKAYFIIEEVEKRKSSYINVMFKKGSGNLYLRVQKTPLPYNNLRFPDEGYYDYKGVSIYSGKCLQIPEKVYENLGKSSNIKLQLLVTISAETGSYEYVGDNNKNKREVQYTIYYSNEPKRINQNEPYDGYILQGEYQYFNFYFDKSTENIYIGLTNMNGDADMYLNRGSELPTPEKNHWKSTDTAHEYIDINKDDRYFIENKKEIYGYYTLLLTGFLDTTYSLFISNHKNKVFPLRDNIPSTCWCEKEGEKCYFRYNEVYNKNNVDEGINHNEIIFTTEYLYGSGSMYSKIFVDKELHKSSEFYKNFPDSNNYDFSNKESNQRNYMKLSVSGEKYEKDSTILLTFECKEKTKVDITPVSLKHFSSVEYILENRENIFYLGINDKNLKQSQLTLILNNYEKEKDLIYSVHSYTGDAHFKVYVNSSIWDEKAQKLIYNYKLLKEFDLITNDMDQENNIELYNPYSHDYHNYVSKQEKEKYDDISFVVEPKEEFGFFITCLFDKNWNKLLIGKSQTFYVINQELYGYFDINEEYGDVEFSLSVEKNLKNYAELFIKINVVDKNKITEIKRSEEKRKDEFSLYHYSIPTSENYDYKAITDKTLGKISLNINRLPKLTKEEIEKGNKFIRALFFVRIGQIYFESIREESTNANVNAETDTNQQTDEASDSKTLINIVITPGINNIKYIEARPYEYYFSNLTYETSSLLNQVETKIYSLTCENPNHDLLVIEISSCYGQYQVHIRDELITKENLNKESIQYSQTNYNGKKTIYIENINSKHYYLSITSRKDKYFCRMYKIPLEKCGNNLSYLFYYYTAYSEQASFQDVDKWIVPKSYGNGNIKLELPLIITNDLENNKKDISDFKFDVFATKNEQYTYKMGSICFLRQIVPNKTTIFKIENIVIENKTSLILKDLEPGKYYINILVQNIKTKELLTFNPIEISTRRSTGYSRYIRYILIFVMMLTLVYYINKYRKTRDELIFLRGDGITRTEDEIERYGNYSKNIQYTGLGSSY